MDFKVLHQSCKMITIFTVSLPFKRITIRVMVAIHPSFSRIAQFQLFCLISIKTWLVGGRGGLCHKLSPPTGSLCDEPQKEWADGLSKWFMGTIRSQS